jgi:nucleotide-binding universal stress UspA family protein
LADIKTEKEKEVILELKIRLEEFCDNVRHEQPSCPFVVDNTIVVTGHPVDQIVHQAEEMDADLIVIGSHGRGGLADVTLGSTSRRVLRRCAMPVLVVRLHKNGTR